MKESPTEISVTIDFVLTLDLSEKHPLAALADFLTEQHLESTLLEAMVESLNEHLVEAFN
ncbi:ISH6 family transposase, partial [Halorubrum sp. SD690R]